MLIGSTLYGVTQWRGKWLTAPYSVSTRMAAAFKACSPSSGADGRISRRRFDARRLNPVWDDGGRRRQRRGRCILVNGPRTVHFRDAGHRRRWPSGLGMAAASTGGVAINLANSVNVFQEDLLMRKPPRFWDGTLASLGFVRPKGKKPAAARATRRMTFEERFRFRRPLIHLERRRRKQPRDAKRFCLMP